MYFYSLGAHIWLKEGRQNRWLKDKKLPVFLGLNLFWDWKPRVPDKPGWFLIGHPTRSKSRVGQTFKRPDRKYFSASVGGIQLCQPGKEAAIDSVQMNEHGWVPTKLYLWTLKVGFQHLFTCYKMLYFYFPPYYLKMWKPFSASGLYENCQQAGSDPWVQLATAWPDCCSPC